MNNKAIGVVELRGFSNALMALNYLSDACNYELIAFERRLGGQLVTVVFQGELSGIQEAIEGLKNYGMLGDSLKDAFSLGNPHPQLMRLFQMGGK
ncbi:MAG: BMC domain-containing protein [Christensenellales bacterium]|jgi:microcompartment protein CcmL/EutN